MRGRAGRRRAVGSGCVYWAGVAAVPKLAGWLRDGSAAERAMERATWQAIILRGQLALC